MTRPNMTPSAKMPAPENMRRTETGPKAENSSRMVSGSCSVTRSGARGVLGGCERHRLAAAAGRHLVRIAEDELGGQLVDREVHFRADQIEHGLLVDQHAHTLRLHYFVAGRDRFGEIELVGHAGAPALLKADAHADHGLVRAGDDVANARNGGIGDFDYGGSRTRGVLWTRSQNLLYFTHT